MPKITTSTKSTKRTRKTTPYEITTSNEPLKDIVIINTHGNLFDFNSNECQTFGSGNEQGSFFQLVDNTEIFFNTRYGYLAAACIETDNVFERLIQTFGYFIYTGLFRKNFRQLSWSSCDKAYPFLEYFSYFKKNTIQPTKVPDIMLSADENNHPSINIKKFTYNKNENEYEMEVNYASDNTVGNSSLSTHLTFIGDKPENQGFCYLSDLCQHAIYKDKIIIVNCCIPRVNCLPYSTLIKTSMDYHKSFEITPKMKYHILFQKVKNLKKLRDKEVARYMNIPAKEFCIKDFRSTETAYKCIDLSGIELSDDPKKVGEQLKEKAPDLYSQMVNQEINPSMYENCKEFYTYLTSFFSPTERIAGRKRRRKKTRRKRKRKNNTKKRFKSNRNKS